MTRALESAIAHRPPSIRQPGISVRQVPLRPATAESVRGYARIVRDFAAAEVEIVPWPVAGRRPLDPGTGVGGGVTEGEFEFVRVGDFQYAENHAVAGRYVTGWYGDPGTASEGSPADDWSHVYVTEANYHPDGSQVFFPRDRTPFVALLALPGDEIRPDDFVAFACDGSFGIDVLPNVWHQPVYPLCSPAVFDDKQGRVHGCVSLDFLREFRTYLEVPLRAT
ncbi:MAG TPA: ureidoglycolate lyase [Gemmataceae bacterium]|nr:ureidoglycolate lyase [Gemmataceae bacterium]